MNVNQAEIIVIDDDVIMQRLISNVLSKTGYRVRAAGDVPAGLALIEEKLPDLVLCDMALPVLTGMDFLKHCRSTPGLNGLLVIIVSSVSDENNVRDALALGAIAHISKPFSQAQLLQVVAEHLRPRS
jgi:two-component system response regulator (stage 0 sporulation protein F)